MPYMERLHSYGEAFNKLWMDDWAHYRNKEDFDRIYNLDAETKIAFESIYVTGRDCAGYMSDHLRAFNDVERFPTLTAFIESFEKNWVNDLKELQETASRAKQCYEKAENQVWAVGQMIELFETQISLLKATQDTLRILKDTRLYKIETGQTSVEETKTTSIQIGKMSGQSRLNFRSNDSSQNMNFRDIGLTFEHIKFAVETQIPPEEHAKILEKLELLESSLHQGDGSFQERYKEFMSAAANHMTIIAPFIPALTALL